MSKKIYRYGVRFPITTTAWITLTRNENDIPVKDLMFSVSEDETFCPVLPDLLQ